MVVVCSQAAINVATMKANPTILKPIRDTKTASVVTHTPSVLTAVFLWSVLAVSTWLSHYSCVCLPFDNLFTA